MYDQIIEWRTKSGKRTMVRIWLETEQPVDLDGDQATVAVCERRIHAEVEGFGVAGFTLDRRVVILGGITYPASIGRLLIPAEQLARIESALHRIDTSPEWQAHLAAEAKTTAEMDAYDIHRAKMREVMGY